MGFCRRCGDIVTDQRCNKCGGSVVAPAVSWTQTALREEQDKWSKTYVSREKSTSPVRPKSRGPPEGALGSSVASTSSAKRFPRGTGAQITGSPSLDNRITDHIASAASRPDSPLKPTVTGPNPESGILPSLTPHDTTLSKVYGSVLQPRESLTTHSCAACAAPFIPDAIIYPDPVCNSDEPRFLCRQCFIISGGSKGLCPNCSKPVTILKAEGGFVYVADKYWHKKCFNCEGCCKNIGDSPMVDLLGRPSCAECFDTCLSRDSRTSKRVAENPTSPLERRFPGGYNLPSSNKYRESSPAIEELEQRLGIAKSREGSPAIEELSHRLGSIGKDYRPRGTSISSGPVQTRSGRPDDSPTAFRRLERFKSPDFEGQSDAGSSSTFGSPRRASGSPVPNTDAIEEMKSRFLRNSTASPAGSAVTLLESSPTMSISPLRTSQSTTSLRGSFGSRIPIPISRIELMSPSSSSTPDLMSDISDATTQSSFSEVDSPPRTTGHSLSRSSRYNSRDFVLTREDDIIEETKSQLNTPNQTPQSTLKTRSNTTGTPTKTITKTPTPSLDNGIDDISATTVCAKCNKPLFSLKEGGKFVTVPSDDVEEPPKTFHKGCFRCMICDDVFKESSGGQAVFVKSRTGPAHIDCAPPEKIVIRKSPSAASLRFSHEKGQLNNHTPTKSPSPSPQRNNTNQSSSRFERPPSTTPATTTTFPRFGSRSACPGCHKSVSPMERGVVPGPQGSKWHMDCLVCGGKRPPSKSTSWMVGRGEEKKKEPGCGKKLDSAAKTDTDGRVWCRECLLMLGVGGSPQVPSTHTLPDPSLSGQVAPHLTGTTTIARQFTGLGGTDAGLLKQLTGGSISPTRSLSPTKQLGSIGPSRPRPKSVIGMRSSKSIDEGRGMFLVKQLTGASSSPGHWEA